jgi:hypothetical protein
MARTKLGQTVLTSSVMTWKPERVQGPKVVVSIATESSQWQSTPSAPPPAGGNARGPWPLGQGKGETRPRPRLCGGLDPIFRTIRSALPKAMPWMPRAKRRGLPVITWPA